MKKEKAQRFGLVALQHLADGEKVAQALGHFFFIDAHKAVVHPKARQGLAAGAFALGNFVFVVRKLQVGTAAVDVERLAQQRAAHGRALDVPARPPGAVRAGPLHFGGLVGLGRFPEHEVERVALVVGHGHALAGAQLVEALARELAVASKGAHGVVHVAVRGAVGQPLLLQLPDQGQHLRHVVGGARFVGRALDAQRVGVLVQGLDHARGQAADGFAVVQRAGNDLVVDVGDVAHVGHAVAAGLEPALHHVESQHGARVPEVAQVINRHAADVEAHMAGLQRLEGFEAARERVVDAQGHGRGANRGNLGTCAQTAGLGGCTASHQNTKRCAQRSNQQGVPWGLQPDPPWD